MGKILLALVLFLIGSTIRTPEDVHHPVKGTYRFVEESEGNLSLVDDAMRILVYQQFTQMLSLIKDPHRDFRSATILVNKQFGLPADFVPYDLIKAQVPLSPLSRNSLIRKDVNEALKVLFDAAKAEGVELWFHSGYRSYTEQKRVYQRYVRRHGEKSANTFSAKPGYSEHQTGLAVDITSPKSRSLFSQGFGDSKEGKWLAENSYRFGFVIRYPKEKSEITGYIYEPWHLRYVGIDLAITLFESGLVLEESEN
jgi:zinc D-Ala-D-Ala carboxypeptidase